MAALTDDNAADETSGRSGSSLFIIRCTKGEMPEGNMPESILQIRSVYAMVPAGKVYESSIKSKNESPNRAAAQSGDSSVLLG